MTPTPTDPLTFHRQRLKEAQAELERNKRLGFPVTEELIAIAGHKEAIDMLKHKEKKQR